MSIKVSVIVPCYNVEKYVSQCIKSICEQTLKEIEIICINDGSKDNTLNILEELKKYDNRIVIINKNNSGYGHSVNIGIDAANGKYIGIVESDDFIDPDMYEDLYNASEFHNLDVCRCCYYEYHTFDNSNKKNDFPAVPKNVVFCPLEDNQAPFWQKPTVWINLYKKDWLKKNDIRFLETPGASYQDVSFSFKIYCKAKRFMMLDRAYLHYRTDNIDSSVNSCEKEFCVCDEWKEIKTFVANTPGLKDKLRHTIPCVQLGNYRWNYNRIIKNKNRYEFIQKWSKELREYIAEGSLIWKRYTKKERRILFIISYFPFLYKNRKKPL